MNTLKDELRAAADLVQAPREAQLKTVLAERKARWLPPAIERIDALMREWAAEGGYCITITLSAEESYIVHPIIKHYHTQELEATVFFSGFEMNLTLVW